MYGTWVLIIMILISSFPAIAVYIWFRIAKYKYSPTNNGSLVMFLITLLIGAAAIFPAILFQNLLSNFSPASGRAALFYDFFFRIAFTEEVSRLLMLFGFFFISNLFLARKEKNRASGASEPVSWNTLKRGCAAGLIAGLGFAVLETAMIYTTANKLNENFLSLLIIRALTAAPLHAACGSRIGGAAVLLRTNPVQAVFRIISATAIHGVYNLMISIPGFPTIMAILIAISALISAILSIKGSWEP